MVEVEVELQDALEKSAGKSHKVTLVVIECGLCNGALGIDASYLDQQDEHIRCPYCNHVNEVN